MKLLIDKKKTLCLTGHRPKGLPWGYNENDERCLKLKETCKQIFTNAILYGVEFFLTGMAEGFDMIGAEILLELKEVYSNIKIIAVLPCKNQDIKWKANQQERYKNILNKCDDIITISDSYTTTCMNDRNKFMVDNSSFCIACFNGKPSGTRNTILYAKDKSVKVKIINP